ncbi:MAG: nucleoside triphosphate pyrophosphohydrolase [Treponema sp.]|jgi:tetrapyrrole methylase family protein/MazG family protein|nr:nucleoside triphosphate pyrophosphohydrolase [Treponema sp.]
MAEKPESETRAFKDLYDIVIRLRAPDGCPWDREQTPLSLRSDLIEETYECVEAIEEQDSEHIKEELGDVFLVTTMLAYMHEQEGHFSVADVLETVSQKLVRRHPHVFGNETVKDSAEVLRNWARIKVDQEGRKPKESILDEVHRGLPPLERAYKLQKKAAKVGFDWLLVKGIYEKLEEELNESREATDALAEQTTEEGKKIAQAHLEEELGDVLFVVVNLCRFLRVDPSIALARANSKFSRRFTFIEQRMKERNRKMNREHIELMEDLWHEAKRYETDNAPSKR